MGEEAFKSEIGEGKKESYGGLRGIEGIGMGSWFLKYVHMYVYVTYIQVLNLVYS